MENRSDHPASAEPMSLNCTGFGVTGVTGRVFWVAKQTLELNVRPKLAQPFE